MEETTILTPELVSEIKQISTRLLDLYRQGIIRIDPQEGSVLVTEEIFEKNFPDEYIVMSLDHVSFPYKKFTTVDGIKFFAYYRELPGQKEDAND
ncbi:MAG: hypothetical protein GX808_03865 [Syntrophomonadaceae bacterium]|jgi:hypothetical protein|nr:hypothetical protein [Syntrophomonadaceae bacterium]